MMSVEVEGKNLFTKEMTNVFETEVIECPDCGFEFASKHEQDESKGCYECPSCNESNLEVEVKNLKEYIGSLEHEKQLLYGRLNNISDLVHKKIK